MGIVFEAQLTFFDKKVNVMNSRINSTEAVFLGFIAVKVTLNLIYLA